MGPKQSTPDFVPRIEQPTQPVSYEAAPQPGFESMPARSIESAPERHIAPPVEQAPALQPAAPVLPSPLPQALPADNTPVAQASTAPIAANDDDLIEKEWVDQTKKIIAETRDDPYRREQEVGRLQREYIRKRYGREIGAAGE